MKQDAKYHHVPRWFEYISQLGASLLVDATGRLFRDYDPIPTEKRPRKINKETPKLLRAEEQLCYESEDDEVMSPQERADRYNKDQKRQKTKGQPLLTLEYLVSSMSIFDITNAHDSVYALLAIAKDTTPTAVNKKLRVTDHTQSVLEMFTARKQYHVDYKADYIDICKEFIQFCVRQNVSRDPSRALDVICRPWAVDITTKDEEQPLPSWLPRLSKASYGMILGPGIDGMRMGRKNADSLVGLPNVTHRNYNAAETRGLDRKTFRFRTWKREIKPASSTDDSKTSTSLPDARLKAGALPAQINGMPVEALPHGAAIATNPAASSNQISLYVKGFILDHVGSVQSASQSGSIPTSWAGFAHWNMESTPPDHFWRTLVADRGRDGKNPPVYYSRACQESFRKGGHSQGVVDTMGLIEHERNSVVAQFCRRVQAAIWNRALIETKKMKRLGLVDSTVKENDLICILYGCSVPVVLRRYGPKKQAVMDFEMHSELQYIATYFVRSYKKHLERREVFRRKREEDKAKYQKWENEKREEWKKDENWKAHWKLVRAGIVQIHDFRAWVLKNQAVSLRETGQAAKAEEIVDTMRGYVRDVLPRMHEIAKWSADLNKCQSILNQAGSANASAAEKQCADILRGYVVPQISEGRIIAKIRNGRLPDPEKGKGTILDRLPGATRSPFTPETFKLTPAQIELWKEFSADTKWREWWDDENQRYIQEEGFKAWAREHNLKHKIGYEEGRKETVKKWEEPSAKEWTQEWATENSWFLCIDPFRAWLREKAKIHGSEDTLDHKQEWDEDEQWHSDNKNKYELQTVAFAAWMREKGRDTPERDFADTYDEVVGFEEWRIMWRNDHRGATMKEEREAWDAEWEQRKSESENRWREEDKRRKETAEKQPFLERWREGWCPEIVNWREFEIALSYGKYWVHFVKRRKQNHVRAQGEEWASPDKVKDRQSARKRCLRHHYGSRTLTAQTPHSQEGSQPSGQSSSLGPVTPDPLPADQGSQTRSSTALNGLGLSLSQSTTWDEKTILVESPGEQPTDDTPNMPKYVDTAICDSPTASKDGLDGEAKSSSENNDKPSATFEPSQLNLEQLEHSSESFSAGSLSVKGSPRVSFKNGQGAVETLKGKDALHPGPPKRALTYSQQAEDNEKKKQKSNWQEEQPQLLNKEKNPFHSRKELKDLIEKKTTDYKVHWEKTVAACDAQYEEWKKKTPKALGKDGKFRYDRSRPPPVKGPPDSKLTLEERIKRREAVAARLKKCRYPQGHHSWSKVRANLTKPEQDAFMENVWEKFRSKLRDDGKWYYEMLGECYIHGMMDGEAMAYQNDNGIRTSVFEIR